ncbi:MAG: pyruvate kinase alpha/beta domain-containing protein [Candidatus Heimdallarchaeaceae archaeon]
MVLYFEKVGDFTKTVFEIVKKRIAKDEIKQIVVATTSGKTALLATDFFDNKEVIAVTHQAGFREPGEMEISKETIVSLKEKGVKVITATHVLAGIDRAIRKKHGTWMISELIAETLRTFGQGTKVCAEIVMMAADSGILRVKEDVIAVGGTGRGADTAWVMKPAHSHQFFNLRFKELLCKPKEF